MKTKTLEFKPFEGLHIVCKKCGKQIEKDQSIYNGCNHPIERQRYKALFHRNGKRPTRDLKALNYDGAISELLKFKQELDNPLTFTPKVTKQEEQVELFSDCILMYSDWLENIDVPFQEQKTRSKAYCSITVSYIQKLEQFLKTNGYNLNSLKIKEVDQFAIGKYYEHLNKTVLNPATWNHHTRALKNFYHFLIDIKGYNIPNPVKNIKLRHENIDPRSVDDADFMKLLDTINPEDSIETYKSGAKKNRYRTYLKDAFMLAATTGMRIEETAVLRFSDLVLDINGMPKHLNGTDLKFERAHNMGRNHAKKIVPIPISPELENLLIKLDYKKQIGTDRYIIAPESKMNRKSLAKEMSHCFTFWRRKAGLGDSFSLKHLRKTFLTKLETQTGLTTAAGYQRTSRVIYDNYIDKTKVTEAIKQKGFNLFNGNISGTINGLQNGTI